MRESKLMVFVRHLARAERLLFLNALLILALSLWPCISVANGVPEESIDKDIIRGIELLYNGETDAAESLFHSVIAQKAKDPMGYFYLAMVSWSRLSSGFWSRQMVDEYMERIDRAISVARAVIDNREADSLTYFYLGGALGFKGRFQLMERKWFSSFLLAADAIEALKTCQKMAPDNRDVLLGLGIFDYYTAKLSGVLKFLTYLMVHRGDKVEGLRKLHIAASEATYSSVEAKSVLLHIYLYMEDDCLKALPLAKEMAERFKGWSRYRFFEGVNYIRLGMDSRYREVLDRLRSAAEQESSKSKADVNERQALYLEAYNFLFHERYEEARSRLNAILSIPDPSAHPAMIAWPILKIGMSYDLEGNRDKALEHYRRILEMENGAGAQFLAEKFTATPANKKDPFLGY